MEQSQLESRLTEITQTSSVSEALVCLEGLKNFASLRLEEYGCRLKEEGNLATQVTQLVAVIRSKQLVRESRLTEITQTFSVEAALDCLERLRDFAFELSEECGLKPEGNVANQIGRAAGVMRQRARIQPSHTRVSDLKMRTVGYGRTVNTGNYENLKYYFEAEVEPDDHWFNCLGKLVEKINDLEGDRKHVLDAERECEELERRKARIQAQVDRLQSQLKGLLKRIDEASNFLKQHGIDPLTTPGVFFLPQPQEPAVDIDEDITGSQDETPPEPVPDPDDDDDDEDDDDDYGQSNYDVDLFAERYLSTDE